MTTEFGLKELYNVVLKTTYPIEIEGRSLEKGETIAAFDKIQMAILDENKKFITAHGGFDDRPRVWWEETHDVNLSFSQGIFSKTQLALMTNAKLTHNMDNPIMLNEREVLESDEDGVVHISHNAYSPLFIYDISNGQKITNYTIIDSQTININESFKSVLCDYWYSYDSDSKILWIGQALTHGYLMMTARTRVKDDITGQTKTGIIQIPKLKLMSDLSMRLGKNANPVVGKLDAVAVPDGERGQKRVMELIFLDNDIDSDI